MSASIPRSWPYSDIRSTSVMYLWMPSRTICGSPVDREYRQSSMSTSSVVTPASGFRRSMHIVTPRSILGQVGRPQSGVDAHRLTPPSSRPQACAHRSA
eukprot:865878-Ditylum_brightwellii.AAC.1